MPTYQNSTPPYALSSGDIGFSFNDEAFPAANTAVSQFALPSYTGISDGGTAVRWQTIFGTAPSAVNIVLQGAINDVDAEYQTIDTTTAVAGEGRSVPNNASGTTSPSTGTLPQQIPLPQPIVVTMPLTNPSTTSQDEVPTAKATMSGTPRNSATKPAAPEPKAVIPAADLKPLYDFALDCKACQSKLTAAQSDLADEKSKTVTLTKERDEAIRTAKGGSALQRFARAAKWLLIGAAAGTLAARATK
jgi:hypothetical protein